MAVLASLRAAARGDPPAADDDDTALALVTPRLCELRRGARDITARVLDSRRAPAADEAATFVEVVRGVWDTLASLPPSHDAALPPLCPMTAIT